MNRHDKRLTDLLVVAEDTSEFRKTKHAAAIYIGNKLIAVGVNQFKTHPMQAKFGRNDDAIYLHAEIDAITNALRRVSMADLSRATMYIARSKNSQPKLSKPCAGCRRAIIHFGIRDIHWTTEEK